MRCSRPGRAGHAPRAGPASRGRAGRARTRGSPSSSMWLGSVAKLDARCRAGRPRRAAATARSRWPGSRRRAGSPACGSFRAMRAASMATSKQCGRAVGGHDRQRRLAVAAVHGHAAGRPARSWWAARWTGPPRWMSMTTSGSSRLTARPMVSALRARPGPAGGGDAQVAAEGGAERGADAGDLVLGLQGAHAEVLVLGQLVEDVRGRGDGVASRGTPAARRAGRRPPGPRPARCCR